MLYKIRYILEKVKCNPAVLLAVFISFLLSSCEEEFMPDLGNKYESLLVVDGLITNNPGPYIIKLSLTTSVENPVYIPLKNCELKISDDAGNEETLTETGEGVYSTKPGGIVGTIGRSYKLTIHRPDGRTYESDFDELLPPIAIDTIYPLIEYKPNDNFPFPVPGYQFYISSLPANNQDHYLRWEMEQTFEYNVDFRIYYYYDGELHDFPDHDSLQYCWKTNQVRSIFTTTTSGLSESSIQNYPLHYIAFDNRIFSIKYSLLVYQLTISEASYNFWRDVKEQNTEGGTLYTHLPYQIRGNVYNTGDKSEPVAGYFQVAGEDAVRIFVDRPPATVPMYYTFCELTEADYHEYGNMFRFHDPKDWPKYVTVDANGGRAVPNKLCSDCRELGGTIVKPYYWEDKK